MKYFKICFFLCVSALSVFAQGSDRWQQKADYVMGIDLNSDDHSFEGTQEITYTNNSPDDLNKIFYHLFFNAFQPGSMMDERSNNISDPDPRVGSKIKKLKAKEYGILKVLSLKIDGAPCSFEHVGTILEVQLPKSIKAGQTVVLNMTFNGQVPVLIRRAGRNNKEGIDYSMSQWYPKLCEYDYQGWHADPYVGREFYGVWGDWDVSIIVDKKYTVGATGILQKDSPSNVGKGKRKWVFKAQNVHDFVWGADPDYKHLVKKAIDGPEMHFYYQPNDGTEAWSKLPEIMDKAFTYINKNYGKYPFDKYSFIQGGDGGMEYPLATLITGKRQLKSLVGVSVHELMHSWFQMVLGSNESLHAWMDEGFTSYASNDVMNHLVAIGAIPGANEAVDDPQAGFNVGYINFAKSGAEEALSTHADHFKTNQAYSVASYVKGCVFLNQMKYIIGEPNFKKGMLNYFEDWKFKHPNPNDFIRVMEKTSGLELDWFKENMVYTINTIDYAIKNFSSKDKKTTSVKLENKGDFPMPIDLVVTTRKGDIITYNIPLRIMRGNKPAESDGEYNVLADWPWTNRTYTLELPIRSKNIKSIEIDPSHRMADVDRNNNQFENAE